MNWYQRFSRFISDAVLPWVGAIAVHALVLAALVFSLGWRHQATPAVASGGPAIEAIEAVVIDSAMLDAPVRRREEQAQREAQRLAERRRVEREAQAREEAARLEREEQARIAQLAREAEDERQAELRAAEEARLEQEQRAREAEARRQEEERRLAEERRQAEERRLAEEKRREEERRAEERRRAEQARVAAQQREAEQLLLAALAEEEDRQAKVNAGLLAQYKAQVKQKVERNWARPPEAEAGLSCEVNVRQLRDGQVIKVEFGPCNGNEAVKRSIEGAVNRASPLPPPPDPSLFDEYVVFIFEPE